MIILKYVILLKYLGIYNIKLYHHRSNMTHVIFNFAAASYYTFVTFDLIFPCVESLNEESYFWEAY